MEKLSKQVQLDYYKRRLTEDTLRNVLADYTEKIRILDQQIEDIEKKHGIATKNTRAERRIEEKEPISEEPESTEKQEEGIQ